MIRNPEPDKSASATREAAPGKISLNPWSWVRIAAVLAAAALLGAGASGVLLHAARGRDSSFETVRAWAAVRKAELRLRRDAPEKAGRLAELVRYAETGECAWIDVLVLAYRFTVEEAGRGFEDWTQIEARAAGALTRARGEIRTPGVGRREAALFRRAEVELAAGRRLAAAGDPARAVAAAEVTLHHTAAIHQRWLELHARFLQPDLLARWRDLVTDALQEARRPGRFVLVIDKLERRLAVYGQGRLQAAFQVELGSLSLERKLHAGDRATPEGRYRVTRLRVAPDTQYYKALLLDYPNKEDRRRYAEAKRRGQVPAGRDIGSLIEIHGDGGRGNDWTNGCVALTNDDMDRLFRYVRVGTPVTIVGTVPEDVHVP